MKEYILLEKLVDNENVVNMLSQALLPGEDSLLVESIETSKDKDVFNVYAAKKGYCSKADLTFLAKLTRKNIEGINNYYIDLEGTWKEELKS